MKYNTFSAMIRPFINARGQSLVFPPESIEATVNVAVQQIYNEYKWSWQLLDETIDTFTDVGDYFTADITYPVKYIVGLEYTSDADEVIEMFPEHSVTQLSETVYSRFEQKLQVYEEQTFTLTYLRDYEFLEYVAEPSTEIPLPNKMIPALYYLVLSQLDLIDTQQLQGQPANNFNKYQYEMKNLKDNDMGYEAQLIGGNPQ